MFGEILAICQEVYVVERIALKKADMKTIFDPATTEQLIERIRALQPGNKAAWGKMSVWQMLKHCTLSEEMFLGKKVYKRLFIGRLFGAMVLKGMLKNENPLRKNQPTHPVLKIAGEGNFEAERSKWIGLLKEYQHFSDQYFVHPFFGKMSKVQVGQFVYKHTDHHLRQFGN